MSGIVLKNTFTQPGSVVSALMLNGLPLYKNDETRELTVFSYIYRKNDAVGGQNTCAVATKINGGSPDDAVINFKGTETQIYNIVRHIAFESFAKAVYEGRASLDEATSHMTALAERDDRQTPLLITTDKIFAPVQLTKNNDYHARRGPIYDFYAQNWQEGLIRAQEQMSEAEHADEDLRSLLDVFEQTKLETVFPSFFFAHHRFANHQANAYDVRSVFDICVAGPHQIGPILTVNNENGAYIALSLLNDGFIGPKAKENPRQKQLRIFNSLHYDEICAKETKYMEGVKKSHLIDSIIAQRGLS